MTTTDFVSATADNYVQAYGPTGGYPTPSGGYVVGGTTDTSLYVGQHVSAGDFASYQAGIAFDTSAIGAGASVTSATLSLYGSSDLSTTDFTVEARLYDWGAVYNSTDFRTAAQLEATTLLATYATSGGWSTSGYNTFTDVAMAANVNKTGTTYIVLASSRWRTSTAPSGSERVLFYSYDQGDGFRPKLTVTYSTTSIKSVGGVAQASIKSVAGVPIASVKSVAGVT